MSMYSRGMMVGSSVGTELQVQCLVLPRYDGRQLGKDRVAGAMSMYSRISLPKDQRPLILLQVEIPTPSSV